MAKLNDNYYLRKCFLEREQVPTQSVMVNRMSPPLANVYFKSMTPKLKVLAGLEPPMKGGGNDWYIPPQSLLDEGRVVLKPVKNEHLKKLGYSGISCYGVKLEEHLRKHMEEEKEKALHESDETWKEIVLLNCYQQWEDASKELSTKNTLSIQKAFLEFTNLYCTSITKIEALLFDAAGKQVQDMKVAAFAKMQAHYETLLKRQATMLYDRYTNKLMKTKERLKAKFISKLEESRTAMGDQIHDLTIEKHLIIEKLRQLLESMNLACQVYVALKEREECNKEIEKSKLEHKKIVKKLKEQIDMKDFEIQLAQEKEKKTMEFNTVWQKKMCHVVKKFQLFVTYCFNALPEYAEFFMDMEKLLMLQLDEALTDPSAESIFESEPEVFHTPVAKPHPFYLFCDKGYKVEVDQNLCPKHCTSSASQLPVVIVNKRCIYAACDNFERFTDKIMEYIHGRRGDDIDFHDNHDYALDVPVKMTSSQQLSELKLESSLLQVLQEEYPNLRGLPLACCICKIPYCFCSPSHASQKSSPKKETIQTTPQSIPSGVKIETRSQELVHEREPKWKSFLNYVKPDRCKCGKRAKKHLEEHLPAYMRKMSPFDAPELPNYEKCTVDKLRKLVKKAQGKRTPPPPIKVESKTRNVSTQCSDQQFDFLCTCFSDEVIENIMKKIMSDHVCEKEKHFKVVGADVSPVYLSKSATSFVTERAFSLRRLLDDTELQEIFRKPDCDYV